MVLLSFFLFLFYTYISAFKIFISIFAVPVFMSSLFYHFISEFFLLLLLLNKIYLFLCSILKLSFSTFKVKFPPSWNKKFLPNDPPVKQTYQYHIKIVSFIWLTNRLCCHRIRGHGTHEVQGSSHWFHQLNEPHLPEKKHFV